jgi:hypothetical protein
LLVRLGHVGAPISAQYYLAMSARIVNKLRPEDATSWETPEKAQAELAKLLKEREARGWAVRKTEDDAGPVYEVLDEQGRPEGLYCIEEG